MRTDLNALWADQEAIRKEIDIGFHKLDLALGVLSKDIVYLRADELRLERENGRSRGYALVKSPSLEGA